jgi:hypothetical protein
MTYERWQTLKGSLKDKFPQFTEGTEELDPGPGHYEFLECTTPMGQVRLELEVRPRILEKKTYFNKRAGSGTVVEYKYDENEHTLTLKAFRFDQASGDWVEVKPEAFAGHV